MNQDPTRYFRALKTLDTFVDRSLELTPKSKFLSGFHYNGDLLKASAANTYVETVGNKADSLHRSIKKVPISNIYWEYLETVKFLGKGLSFKEKMLCWHSIIRMKIFMGIHRGFGYMDGLGNIVYLENSSS